MRRILILSLCGPALLSTLALGSGCRATPGFTVRWELHQPSTLNTAQPVTAVEAPPVGYAVEDVQPWPHYARQPLRYGLRGPGPAALSYDACPPCPPCPQPLAAPAQPQMLPQKMPQGASTGAGARPPSDCP